MLTSFLLVAPTVQAENILNWEEMPPLPKTLSGFALGNHNGVLIVAGGIDQNDGYSDEVYVLLPGAAEWKLSDTRLPDGGRASCAGVSDDNGLWLIGGTNGREVFRNFLLVRWADETVHVDLPSPLQTQMPAPLHGMGHILVNGVVYLIGGVSTLDAPEPTNSFFSLDLRYNASKWQKHTDLPGDGRVEPIVTLFNGAITVMGGYNKTSPNLPDMWVWNPDSEEWTEDHIENIGWPGAPTIIVPPEHVLVFRGSDSAELESMVEAVHGITKTTYPLETMPPIGRFVKVTPFEDGWVCVGMGLPDENGTSISRSYKITLNETKQSALAWPDYLTLGLYFSVLIYIGYYFSKREKTTEAFFLGSRKIPWWAVGISIFGTSLSAITYIAIPATAFSSNWVTMLNNMGIVFLAPFIAAYYIPRLKEVPYTTAYEYLEKRFNLGTRIYGSLVFVIFQIGRMSIVLYLPAIALSAATGIPINYSIILMGILATAYTVLGGIEAVIWTDVLQSVVLLLGAVLTLGLVISNTNLGAGELISVAKDADKFHAFNWSWDLTTAAVWVTVIGGIFANAYPAMADQTVVQRYLSTASPKEASKALWTNALLTIPIQFLFFGIGTALWIYYHQNPGELVPGLQNDAILPLFVIQQFPVGLKGVLIAGLFAASMSSLDSSMNSLASVFVNDYYRRFVPNNQEHTYLRIAKGTTILLGVFATCSALYVTTFDAPSLFTLFLQLLGLVGGGLAGIFVLGVCSTKANGVGALTGGIVSGCVMYYVRGTEVHFFLHGMIGFLTSLIVGYMVSRSMPENGSRARA